MALYYFCWMWCRGDWLQRFVYVCTLVHFTVPKVQAAISHIGHWCSARGKAVSAIANPAVSTGSVVDVQVTVKALHLPLCDVLLVPPCLSIDLSMSDAAGPPVLYLAGGGGEALWWTCHSPETPRNCGLTLFRVFIRNAVSFSTLHSVWRLVYLACPLGRHSKHADVPIYMRMKCSFFPFYFLSLQFSFSFLPFSFLSLLLCSCFSFTVSPRTFFSRSVFRIYFLPPPHPIVWYMIFFLDLLISVRSGWHF